MAIHARLGCVEAAFWLRLPYFYKVFLAFIKVFIIFIFIKKNLIIFFCTLEEQELVQRGCIKKIEEHFTERSLKLPVKERVKPIEWISAKYKAVHLLKKLRNS